jgi:hypothetical protein
MNNITETNFKDLMKEDFLKLKKYFNYNEEFSVNNYRFLKFKEQLNNLNFENNKELGLTLLYKLINKMFEPAIKLKNINEFKIDDKLNIYIKDVNIDNMDINNKEIKLFIEKNIENIK